MVLLSSFISHHWHVGVCLHGGFDNGPLFQMNNANTVITSNATPKPTLSAGMLKAQMRITTRMAIFVADRGFWMPHTAHQKSQIVSGHVILLLLYHNDNTVKPRVKKISALTKAANPVVKEQPGGMNIRFTKPTAIKICPQYFNQNSQTHFSHFNRK